MKKLIFALLALATPAFADSALSAVTISKTLTLTSPSAYISMTGVSATAYLRTVSATNVIKNGIPLGGVVSYTTVSITTTVSLSAVVPLDNTPPLNGEGDTVLSLPYTPLSANSNLRICYGSIAGLSGAGTSLGLWVNEGTGQAIFGSGKLSQAYSANTYVYPTNCFNTPSTGTSLRTFQLKAGRSSGADFIYLNSTSSGGTATRLWAGTAATWMDLTEIIP